MTEKEILNDYMELCFSHRRCLDKDHLNTKQNWEIYKTLENMLRLYLKKEKELEEFNITNNLAASMKLWSSQCNSN